MVSLCFLFYQIKLPHIGSLFSLRTSSVHIPHTGKWTAQHRICVHPSKMSPVAICDDVAFTQGIFVSRELAS